ncbi:uncharacterized protein LOC134536249 [Bacillus rossius redtenbacheri]|uniref:uncharacterized protein LOC134536249 n=1 Tax=Bacillus rossius redtenbacheri TaxID=93214 RepID=UPI002FDCB270
MTSFALLLVAAGVLSSGLLHRRVSAASSDVTQANALADALLLSIRTTPSAYSLEPYNLDDIEDDFKVLFVTYKLYLNNGSVSGASNVTRVGDVSASYNSTTKMENITVGLYFNNINYTGDYLATGPLLNDGGSLNATIAPLYAELNFLANRTVASATTLHVQELTLKNNGTFTLHVEKNNAISEWIHNAMAKILLKLFKGKILHLMENNMVSLLNTALRNMTFNI